MLPVTRANLDYICCICLLDIRPSVCTQKVYDVRKECNMSKVLKLTAHITILKNPMNQKCLIDCCRKICETCFIKIQYSYSLRERIVASTTTVKELVQNNNLNEIDIKKLQFFCRICLNRQKDIIRLDNMHKIWLKECSGIRFTSFIDKEVFRIKEGTNINEIAVIDDKHFPQHLCRCCLKKLKNVDEFRKSAIQSFEYMISVIGDSVSQDHLVCPEIERFEPNIWKNFAQLESERNSETITVKEEKHEESETDLLENQNFDCGMEPLINEEDFINIQQFDNKTMQFMDTICQNSDNSENFSESANYSKRDVDDLKRVRTRKSEHNEINERICETNEDGNIKTDIGTKSSNTSKKELHCFIHKRNRTSANLNESKEKLGIIVLKNTDNEKTKSSIVCEECRKEFSSKISLRKHIKTVHNFDSSKMLECTICFKKFKRKSHMEDHIKCVHEKLKPFKCSYCAKTFTSKSTKRVHELGHTGDFPFICNFCGKGFRRSNQLKIHLDIHTTIPELLCTICKRSQKSKTDLENHLKLHSDKRVQCPLCGKLFSRNFHLRDHHNAVHLKLRPFKCKYCELAFGDRRTRRTHEKMHAEDRPLKCGTCSMGFKSQIGLTRHIKMIGHNTEHS